MAAKKKMPNFKRATLDPALGGKMVSMGGVAALVGIGGAFGLGSAAGDHMSSFMHGYLIAYAFFLSIALGALFFVTLQHLTRSGWSVLMRRVAEGLSAGIAVMAVLLLPLIGLTLAGNHSLWEWTDAALVAKDELIHHKQGYLNVPFFLGRLAFYFLFWIAMSRYFLNKSVEQDQSGDVKLSLKQETVSRPGMILMALTITFASIDLLMSLQPHWFSTIFGVYYFGGSMIAFLAMLILACMWLQKRDLLPGVNVEHYHDMGKLLFGFNFFWSYIAFSQFMLIWYANIPEETEWYLPRQNGVWVPVAVTLLLGHFAIPFVGLISRHAKRRLGILRFWCVWLLVMHAVDMIYLIGPAAGGHGHEAHFPNIGVMLLSFIGVGGAYLAFVGFSLKGKKLIPIKDPRLHESVELTNF